MKVYKTLQFPECTTIKSASSFSLHANSKLLLETAFPRTQHAMTTSSCQTQNAHTMIPYLRISWELHPPNRNWRYWLGSKGWNNTLAQNWSYPILWLNQTLPFWTKGWLPTVRAGSALLMWTSSCTLQCSSISTGVGENLANKLTLSPGLWQCMSAMFYVFISIWGSSWGCLPAAF